jgi:hypothetical protein
MVVRSPKRIDTFPEQSKLENIAMAHYKYLGHDLKRELGESINIRELTEDEERYVRYLKSAEITSRPPNDQIEVRIIQTMIKNLYYN